MVLFALGIVIVSLSVIAYRYRSFTSQSQRPKLPKHEHAERSEVSELHSVKGGQEKEGPAFSVTAPEAPKVEKDASKCNSTASMRNPFEVLNGSNQTAKSMPPPSLKPISSGKLPAPSLMPPPSRPTPRLSTIRAPPKPSNTTNLRPPPSTASTLRGLPASSLAPPKGPSLLAPSASTLAPSKRPSKKVLLEPGHSPLDWAHLTANPPSSTFLRGADVSPSLIRVPPSLLKYHNGRKDRETGELKNAWGVYQGKVYNISPYMNFHPGGVNELMRGAGRPDAERLFNEVHPWVSWENMLGECLVGILVSENEVQKEDAMEEMD